MRFLKVFGLLLCVLTVVAIAKDNKFGVRDSNRVVFDVPVHIGSSVLPAGEYVVRHTMEGEEHVMVFKHQSTKEEVKVKCTLVPLAKKADKDQSTYVVNSANEKVLQELQFQGDSAKHVFQ